MTTFEAIFASEDDRPALLDRARMEATLAHFPFQRPCGMAAHEYPGHPGGGSNHPGGGHDLAGQLMDPAFVLPLLATIMRAPEPPLHRVVESGCLQYALLGMCR